MESTMVMSRNQIQEVREKAQQKREEREARALKKGKKGSKRFRGNEYLSTVDTTDPMTLADESMTENEEIGSLFLEENNNQPSSSELVTSVLELDPSSSTSFEFPSISSTEIQNYLSPNWDWDWELIESIILN